MIWYSADFGTRSDLSARLTISGPIPAQSPSVMPMLGFLLVLILVIAIDFT
jgi:hypothetical protein